MSTWENEIFTNTIKVFGGVIDKPTSRYLSLATNSKIHNITCTDWIYLADKKIVAKAYNVSYVYPGPGTLPGVDTFPGKPFKAGEVVRDLLTNYLAADGVTEGIIYDGPYLSAVVYNYVPVTQCLEGLAELAGYEFNIDVNKQLFFFPRDADYNYNDTIIDEQSDIINVQVEESAEDYRNKQYVRGGKGVTDIQFEYNVGNGSRKSYTVSYPVAKVPRIYVNDTVQTVGIRGVDEGKQWYWNKGEREISQDENATPLTNMDVLLIEYEGLYDLVVVSYDNEEIDRMKGIEGGSGVHENVFDDSNITGKDAAFETANAKLQRYAQVGTKIGFTTKMDNLQIGQLIRVNFDSYGIDSEFLIESIKVSELGTHDSKAVYDVTLVDGAASGGWADFFKKLANNNNGPSTQFENIQEDEVLTTLETFNKTWTSTEQPNIFAQIYPDSTLQPGVNTYPGFEEEDRINFLVFFSGEKIVFRKPVSKKTDALGKLMTTTFISPFEANYMEITHVGWYGGSNISDNEPALSPFIGTVLVDKQPYSINKSDVQALQIDRVDMKGW